MKYSKKLLTKLCSVCNTWICLLQKLDLKSTNGNRQHVKNLVLQYGINVSHFTTHKFTSNKFRIKLHHSAILINDRNSGRREGAKTLRRALVESGREYKCEDCGNRGEWLSNPIVLEVDHINGDPLDNSASNLRFQCPNCHSQKTIKIKVDGRKRKQPYSPKFNNRKVVRPTKDELITLLSSSNYSKVGKQFGVSGNAVKKWLKYYNA